MLIFASLIGLSHFISKASYSALGENVTHGVRKDLYKKILEKNIGWFDLLVNGVSVLTSAMAADTTIINGTATESIAP